jgi:hypothetical protein
MITNLEQIKQLIETATGTTINIGSVVPFSFVTVFRDVAGEPSIPIILPNGQYLQNYPDNTVFYGQLMVSKVTTGDAVLGLGLPNTLVTSSPSVIPFDWFQTNNPVIFSNFMRTENCHIQFVGYKITLP